jgi:hypothetical protein
MISTLGVLVIFKLSNLFIFSLIAAWPEACADQDVEPMRCIALQVERAGRIGCVWFG